MLAAILLAAGESTRMGRPKQLLDWRGEPLVAAQARTLLDAGCRPVVIVLGAYAARVRPHLPDRAEVQVVTNHRWREGRASSIRSGARAVPATVDAVVVASVDQPTDASLIRCLEVELEQHPDTLIAVPRHHGRNGHPPAFRSKLLAELQNVTERQEGLRQLRRRHADRTTFVETDNPIATLNLNTPDDYQTALELL